jgi:hypothetical protein
MKLGPAANAASCDGVRTCTATYGPAPVPEPLFSPRVATAVQARCFWTARMSPGDAFTCQDTLTLNENIP